MRIEFLGTPGAGKTTLYRALLAALRQRGLPVLTRDDLPDLVARRTLAGRLAAALPSERLRRRVLPRLAGWRAQAGRRDFERRQADLLAFVRAAQAQRPAAAGVERRRVLPQFLNMAGKLSALEALARPGEILLLDEAFTHRVVQFYASHVEAPDAAAVSAYLDHVPAPDVLVYVDAPLASCLARVNARGVWEHSRQLTPAELAGFLTNAQAVTRAAAAEARRRGWRVVTVTNDGPPEQAAASLLAELLPWLLEGEMQNADGTDQTDVTDEEI